MGDLQIILTSYTIERLEKACAYLDEHGIRCLVREGFYLPTAMGGAELRVREDQVELAKRMLIEAGLARKEDFHNV